VQSRPRSSDAHCNLTAATDCPAPNEARIRTTSQRARARAARGSRLNSFDTARIACACSLNFDLDLDLGAASAGWAEEAAALAAAMAASAEWHAIEAAALRKPLWDTMRGSLRVLANTCWECTIGRKTTMRASHSYCTAARQSARATSAASAMARQCVTPSMQGSTRRIQMSHSGPTSASASLTRTGTMAGPATSCGSYPCKFQSSSSPSSSPLWPSRVFVPEGLT